MTTPMAHDRCSESLGPFLRGELAPVEAEAVAGHLAICAQCTRERDALAAVLAVEVEPLSGAERARLASAVAAQRRAEVVAFAPAKTGWRARLAPALGAAALIAVVAVSAVWFASGGGEDEGQGGGTTFESTTGGLAGTPAPEDRSLDRDHRRAEKRTSTEKNAIAYSGIEDEAATSSGTTTTSEKAESKSAPAPFSDEGEGGGGGSEGGDEETQAGPPEDQSAKAVAKLSISPSADTAEVGTCNAFTVTVTDADGDPVQGVTLDIEQRHELSQDDTAGNEPNVGFCTPGNGPNPSGVDEGAGDLGDSEEDPDDAGTAGGETTAATNGNGKVTIGIDVAAANGSDGTGDVTLVAFVDTDNDDDPASDEAQDRATNTWVAPGQGPYPYPRTASEAWWNMLSGIF